MTQMIFNMFDAKTNLSKLVTNALNGKDVIIAHAGKPAVRLVPVTIDTKPRIPGRFKGHFVVAQNFDDEDPGINKMFYESDEDDYYKS